MRIVELSGSDECPCGSGLALSKCPTSHPRPSEVFPDQRGGCEGLLIKWFAVYRADGSTAIVMPQSTFRLYCHAELNMELLDAWLVGSTGSSTPPPELKKHFDTVEELSNDKNRHSPIIYTNTYNGVYAKCCVFAD